VIKHIAKALFGVGAMIGISSIVIAESGTVFMIPITFMVMGIGLKVLFVKQKQ